MSDNVENLAKWKARKEIRAEYEEALKRLEDIEKVALLLIHEGAEEDNIMAYVDVMISSTLAEFVMKRDRIVEEVE